MPHRKVSTRHSDKRLLARGLDQLGIAQDADLSDKLLFFIKLLSKWNQKFNLTSITDGEQMIIRHVLDSLSVVPYIKGPRVLDVGTGAGLPGIPLALVEAGKDYVLLDSNAKKTRFLTQAVMELGLTNIHIENIRMEDYYPDTLFNTVITRALGPLVDFATAARHLCHEQGVLVAMKGQYPAEELKELKTLKELNRRVEVLPLNVPYLDAERHLVRLF